jgi:hypothetical protein
MRFNPLSKMTLGSSRLLPGKGALSTK